MSTAIPGTRYCPAPRPRPEASARCPALYGKASEKGEHRPAVAGEPATRAVTRRLRRRTAAPVKTAAPGGGCPPASPDPCPSAPTKPARSSPDKSPSCTPMPAPNRDSIRHRRSAATAEKLAPDRSAPSNRRDGFPPVTLLQRQNTETGRRHPRRRSRKPRPTASDARPAALPSRRNALRRKSGDDSIPLCPSSQSMARACLAAPIVSGAATPPTPLPRCSDPPDDAASIRRRAVVPRPARPAPRRCAEPPSGRPDRPAARRRSARSTSRLCDTAIRHPGFEPPGCSPARRYQSAKSLALSLHDPRARRRGGISIPTSDFLVDRL